MIKCWNTSFTSLNTFWQFGYSALNMATIGNVQQTSTKSGGNALINLAKDDTNIMIVQAEEYMQFLEGSEPVWGTVLNLVARPADSRHEQMKKVKEYAKVARDMAAIKVQIHEENNDNIFIPSKRGGSTKPPKTQHKVFRENLIQDRRKDIKKYPKGH